MMNAMGLGRNQDVAQQPEVGFNVAVIEAGIPESKQIPANKRLQSYIHPQQRKRNKTHDGLDKPIHGMHPQIGEQVEVSLRVVDGMKIPEQHYLWRRM